jgi:surface protein
MPIGRTLLPIASGGGGGEAAFTASVTTIEPSDTVTFTDQTTDITPTLWEWDFGDGEKSTLQNPSHRYKFAGQFTVTLIASDGVDTVFKQEVAYINCSSPDWIVTIDTRKVYDPLRNISAVSADNEFTLTLRINTLGSSTSTTVDWGDGNQDIVPLGSGGVTGITHTYAAPGIYKVKILASSLSPGAPNMGFGSVSGLDNKIKIIEFNNWGSGISYGTSGTNYKFHLMSCIFYATDKPANTVLGGNQMFRDSDWLPTEDNRYLESLFQGFTPSTLLGGADQMFRDAGFGFNANLDNLILDTTLGSGTFLRQTFQNCSRFNQPLSHWVTDGVTDFSQAFNNAREFNQDISGWNVSSATNFSSMFNGARSFNQNISTWDVSNVTNLVSMFRTARNFNQDISGWDVSNATTLRFMFLDASGFDQNLGAWPLRIAGTNLGEIFRFSGMSTENYTDTIVGWANYVFDNSGPINVSMIVQSGMTFINSRPGGANFADAGAARTYLVSQGWSITGDTVI